MALSAAMQADSQERQCILSRRESGLKKEIKEQLGHSTIDMTLDTYAHLLDQSRDEANEAMAKRVPKMATEWAAGGNCCPVPNNRVGGR
jgi:hypothetical protein